MSDGADHRPEKDCSASLYVDVDELRRRINPKIGRDSFIAKVKACMDRDGFPKFSEFWRGWYWPRVLAWLDKQNGLANHDDADSVSHAQEDGPENFDAAPIRKARPQTRTAQPAVLDRPERDARHQGLSGQVHRLAERRQ
jgi:hypothetical protein